MMGPAGRGLQLFVGLLTIYVGLNPAVPLALWGPVSVSIWFAYSAIVGWERIGNLEQYGVLWGTLSAYSFVAFLQMETTFQGWGDVYFFCGPEHEYCTCNFRWNLLGWWKAATVWNFSIATAVGLQKLSLQLGLGGLLPGEEVVTRDSFISVCWRLVPYWLNNWEQNWGTECSSMLFEVPRFAVELLVILPCVQILCSRLKILAAAQIRVVVPEQDAATVSRENVAVNIVKGHWEVDPSQRHILPRLRSNLRIMVFIICLLVVAALNSLWVPLRLEQESLNHHRAYLAIEAGKFLQSDDETLGLKAQCSVLDPPLLYEESFANQLGPQCPGNAEEYINSIRSTYEVERFCPDADILTWSIRKHALELSRMKDDEHRRMIPLIEIALAMMRFSCEKFFVLLTVYVNYLLFREPPPVARALVLLNNNLSTIFQHVVLYTFPAICWAYGAGVIFSTFVSLIFWGAPLISAYRHLSKRFTRTIPKELRPAAAKHIEMMGGNCTICWGTLTTVDSDEDVDPTSSGSALPCGHAYHAACLVKWMDQCLSEHRNPKCPMCQTDIEYQIHLKWPWWSDGFQLGVVGQLAAHRQGVALPDLGPAEGEDGVADFLFGDPNLQGLLDEMPNIFAEVIEDEGHVHRILGRREIEDLDDEIRHEQHEGWGPEEGHQRADGGGCEFGDELLAVDMVVGNSARDSGGRLQFGEPLQAEECSESTAGSPAGGWPNGTRDSLLDDSVPSSTLHQRHRGALLSVGLNSTRTEASPGGGRLGIRYPNPEFEN